MTATTTSLVFPRGIAVDHSGNLVLTDGYRIRAVLQPGANNGIQQFASVPQQEPVSVSMQPLQMDGADGTTYLVGDVSPLLTDLNVDGDRDDFGEFGDGTVNVVDLQNVINAVILAPPRECSDRFDAMDVFPPDGVSRGGNGAITNADVSATVDLVLGTVAPTRRTSRNLSCPPQQ
jgi:hypothetical protein